MTASTTPRLGLLLPASSDTFDIGDFDDTFSKLDNRPGIMPVANFAALPSGLTTANHGSTYLTLDNHSLWQWHKPGAGAGAWVKLNSVGMIQYAGQTSTVSTATTSPSSAPTLITTTFTYPGGRWLIAFFSSSGVRNSGSYGYSITEMWVNGSIAEGSIMSGGAPSKNISHRMFQTVNPGGYGTDPLLSSSVTIKVTLRSTSYGGGTSTADAGGQLYIFEV